MTAGPDGALWFTEVNATATPAIAGKIGRVTTAGSFTEYTLSRSEYYAIDITAGPDGNLWFTESYCCGASGPSGVNGKIGHIS